MKAKKKIDTFPGKKSGNFLRAPEKKKDWKRSKTSRNEGRLKERRGAKKRRLTTESSQGGTRWVGGGPGRIDDHLEGK